MFGKNSLSKKCKCHSEGILLIKGDDFTIGFNKHKQDSFGMTHKYLIIG